jgi:hypothetical protein
MIKEKRKIISHHYLKTRPRKLAKEDLTLLKSIKKKVMVKAQVDLVDMVRLIRELAQTLFEKLTGFQKTIL